MAKRTLRFLTRDGCSLCDDALAKVTSVVRWLPIEVAVVDITSDPGLEEEFHMRVPVLLDRHDQVVAEGEIGLGGAARACLSVIV